MKLLQVLLSALFWASPSLSAPLNISASLDNVLNIKFFADPTEPGPGQQGGTCSLPQGARLRQWFLDCQVLVTNVLQGLATAEHHQTMHRNLAAYFNIQYEDILTQQPYLNQTDGSVERFQTVTDKFKEMDDFLNGRQASKFEFNPWVFCDSDWLVETDQWLDYDARPQTYTDQSGQTHEISLRNTPPSEVTDPYLVSTLKGMQKRAPNGKDCKKPLSKAYLVSFDSAYFPLACIESFELCLYNLEACPCYPAGASYAYYTRNLRTYKLVSYPHQYPGQPPSFCNEVGTVAQAHQFGDPPYKAAITVCPLMWNDPLYFGGDTIADAASSGRASNFDQLLVKTQPQSAVLLHEMFHLSSGDFSNTKDRAYEPIECLSLALTRKDDTVHNPDSLLFFAWSYYLSTQAPGHRWDWSSGLSRIFLIQNGPIKEPQGGKNVSASEGHLKEG